ncbi:hypothetical protein EP331_00815 [bacterium]|nr:MAG: hypothetical protein EP331_00815 [bacterium]
MNLDQIALSLQSHYSDFKVSERLLFTGHSHQAWPNVAKQGLLECYYDAANLVDEKWEKAFERIEQLRSYLRNWYKDPRGKYTPASSTHDLLIKWLSALALKPNDEIVTTGGEFYSIFRQTKALHENGVKVTFVDTEEFQTIDERLYAAIHPDTKAVIISRVFFESGLRMQNLEAIAQKCVSFGVPCLIDDYHGTNVVLETIGGTVFEQVYWLIGGYKYLQWGEGNCFLRYPETCTLKPTLTGWFASFSTLKLKKSEYTIQYDDQMKFAGATFDPTSAYRASKVVSFFEEHQLNKEILPVIYRRRVSELRDVFQSLGLDEKKIALAHHEPEESRAGFMTLRTKDALGLQKRLLKKDVFTDARGEIIRFGPAPYTTSRQIEQVMELLKSAI